MRNTLTIMRRDLGAYFNSPIGYILMMVFVTLSVGLYITSFFVFPVADMRPYFDNLPIFLCVFIPAVTMRMWAEERKENTWEMLLTFPMKAWELVIGKFLAATIFFGMTLAATFTIPMMLASMGNPDAGAIFSGYFGTLLLGAFFLAMGIFVSGFFKDQIVAFAITLLIAFSFFLLGMDFIAGFIDDKIDGLGTQLSNLLGFFSHYSAFTRGVVDLADVVYFIVWTVIFLVLNIMFIDGRNRPGAKTIFGTAFAMSIIIGLLFNWLMSGQSIARADMTEDKIYTVSQASKNILSQIDGPVQVKVYISPKDKMPTQMKDLEQDILDKLEEMRIGSDGKIEYTSVYLEVTKALEVGQQSITGEDEEEEKDEQASVEERMLEKGIQPFSVRALSQDQSTTQYIYSSIGVAYKDKPEEIIPQVMPQTLQELEYRLVSTIYKLSLDEAPIIALVAPKEAVNIDPQMRAIMEQMGQPIPQSDDPYEYLQRYLEVEKYEVRRVDLTKDSPLPEEYDTLVVVNPRSFNERQRWEINRALHSGKPVVLAVQQYEWDYRPSQRGVNINRRDENPEINPLLENYGLGVSKQLLMDESHVGLSIQTGTIQDLLGGGMEVKAPMHILVNPETMDNNTSITSRLSTIFYLWGTALELDEEKLAELGLDAKVVMTSSENSWTVDPSATTTPSFLEPPTTSEMQAYPLMAVIEGQFPDAYAGQERPEWPKEAPPQQPGFPPPPPEDDTPEPPATPVEAKPGKMVLLGTSETFRKNFLQQGNLDLFLNSVDAVTLSENIVNVRGRKPIDRSIPRAEAEKSKTFWRLANYGLANILIAGIGIGYFMMRRQSRNAYTLEQMKK